VQYGWNPLQVQAFLDNIGTPDEEPVQVDKAMRIVGY